MSDFDWDLLVIGSGSGGTRAARVAAGYGARVLVAEESRVGGTCVIRGCVPKKLMAIASHFKDDFEDAVGFGWNVEGASFDWRKLKQARDKDIDRLEAAYRSGLEGAGVKIVPTRAVIEDAHTVQFLATGERHRAGRILVATGARPSLPVNIPGIEHAIVSDDIFLMEDQPKRILVVGGGYIAVEFAGILSGLGSKVTLVHRGDKLLRGFDEDIRDAIGTSYAERGVDLVLQTTLSRIEKVTDGLVVQLSGDRTVVVDQVLIATGRHPNTAHLGLEQAGVTLRANGAIQVNANSRTSVPSIYAVGDVTDRANLTPVAIREGHAFSDSEFGGKPWTVDHGTIATAVFSVPEIGVVGLTEEDARQLGGEITIFKTRFRPMRATLSGRKEFVMMKIVVDAETDKVLGVHIAGREAAEMIQLAAIAVTMGATKADFDRTIAVHPSAAEELVTMRMPVKA